MTYVNQYTSPLGEILLASDGEAITGLWFLGAKYFARGLDSAARERDLPVFQSAKAWLDAYFAGREPGALPPLHPAGTDFQRQVWDLLLQIPYGATTTYGALARRLAEGRGRVSAQAVGGAVGHNPISLLIPCHRVVGAGGSLTGYAGGVDKKLALLRLEGADCSHLTLPKTGAAL